MFCQPLTESGRVDLAVRTDDCEARFDLIDEALVRGQRATLAAWGTGDDDTLRQLADLDSPFVADQRDARRQPGSSHQT